MTSRILSHVPTHVDAVDDDDDCGLLNEYSDCGTGWTFRGSVPRRCKSFYSLPKRPFRLWGPPNLLSKKIPAIPSAAIKLKCYDNEYGLHCKNEWSYVTAPSI
jgi:hypothetical protein